VATDVGGGGDRRRRGPAGEARGGIRCIEKLRARRPRAQGSTRGRRRAVRRSGPDGGRARDSMPMRDGGARWQILAAYRHPLRASHENGLNPQSGQHIYVEGFLGAGGGNTRT
jgi:hypothetical protein